MNNIKILETDAGVRVNFDADGPVPVGPRVRAHPPAYAGELSRRTRPLCHGAPQVKPVAGKGGSKSFIIDVNG